MTELQAFSEDFKALVAHAARAGGFANPVAVDFDDFSGPVMRHARKGPVVAADGVMIREWGTGTRKESPNVRLGLRVYHIRLLRFVLVRFNFSDRHSYPGHQFAVIDRKDYLRFYRVARQIQVQETERVAPPVLAPEQMRVLRENTIGFLERDNLRRIRDWGGRPRRGMLLTGPLGNGKTSACRWLQSECLRRGWEFQIVSADDYASARRSTCAATSVRALFELDHRGIVVFDDFDMALRGTRRCARFGPSIGVPQRTRWSAQC
ncbi:MAG: AAA family ATPase [Gemmataceae bacterium]